MQIATIRVKPWGTDQGDYVEINADDFDPAIHEHYAPHSEPAVKRPRKPKEG